MAVTIKDIAKRLNLDHSTVGYALSGKGTIGKKTRERVLKTAQEMGYVANRMARQMRTGRTHVLGVVMPNVVMGYNELIQYMFRYAFSKGYEVQIALTEFDEKLEEKAVQNLLESRVDALVVRSRYPEWDEVPKTHPLRNAKRRKIPVIAYGSGINGGPFSCLKGTHASAGTMLAEHICNLDHTRIAYVIPADNMGGAHIRTKQAIQEVMHTRGLDPESLEVMLHRFEHHEGAISSFTESSDYHHHLSDLLSCAGLEDGRVFMRRIHDMAEPPTAVISHNEMTAIGMVLEAQQLGIRIPQDIAICAGTRNMITNLCPVSLTTVEIPPDVIARNAIDFMLEHIEGNVQLGCTRELAHELIIAESTIGRDS